MTIRSSNEAIRKAPKVTRLVLNRETLQELTESETEDVAGGGIFRPRPTPSRYRTCKFSCGGNSACCLQTSVEKICTSV